MPHTWPLRRWRLGEVRFPPNRTAGIIFIRRGNLTSEEEIGLVRDFLSHHSPEDYAGRLVTLYKNSVKIR